MLLLFSHKLTNNQKIDVEKNLNIYNFLYLPEDLQKIWSQVPAELTKEELQEFLKPIKNWIKEHYIKNDVVLAQGDFGATYIIVEFCKSVNIKTYYSTNRRVAQENHEGNKVHVSHIFEHVMFREF